MQPEELSQSLKSRAAELGFAATGVCAAVQPAGFGRLQEWIDRGYAGEMSYFASRRGAYQHPRHVLDGVVSIVMLATVYRTREPRPVSPGSARISRYAFSGHDYHDWLFERTEQLADFLRESTPAATCRSVVDTAPLLEREFASLAGLGWQGKNTLLLNRTLGSWFFLSAVLTDIKLEFDEQAATDHCGTCTACLQACPTNAFVQPNLLDATRCISYLTIEHRSPIPRELRRGIGDWLFGCDICQDVCPWNNKAPRTADETLNPEATLDPIELGALFSLDDAAFRQRFRHTPLWRSKRRGILRNAAIVLGNQRHPQSLPALQLGINDAEPLVRGAAAWALGEFAEPVARAALQERLAVESDRDVRDEIQWALEQSD